MKPTLFNDEIEHYTNGSTVKYIILGAVIFSIFVAMGWVISLAPRVIQLIDMII